MGVIGRQHPDIEHIRRRDLATPEAAWNAHLKDDKCPVNVQSREDWKPTPMFTAR